MFRFLFSIIFMTVVAGHIQAQYLDGFSDPWLFEIVRPDYSHTPNKGDRRFRFLVGDKAFVEVGPQNKFDRYHEVLQLIDHKEHSIRLATVLDLKGYGTVRAARAVTSRLGDPNQEVRETAAWALGEMGHRGAIRPLIDALAYTHGPPCQTIAASLKKLTGKNFGTSYRRWWAWYEAVRRDF